MPYRTGSELSSFSKRAGNRRSEGRPYLKECREDRTAQERKNTTKQTLLHRHVDGGCPTDKGYQEKPKLCTTMQIRCEDVQTESVDTRVRMFVCRMSPPHSRASKGQAKEEREEGNKKTPKKKKKNPASSKGTKVGSISGVLASGLEALVAAFTAPMPLRLYGRFLIIIPRDDDQDQLRHTDSTAQIHGTTANTRSVSLCYAVQLTIDDCCTQKSDKRPRVNSSKKSMRYHRSLYTNAPQPTPTRMQWCYRAWRGVLGLA